MSSIPHKVCVRCGVDKPLAEFSKQKSHSDGLQSYCKSCVRAYRLENIGRIKQNDAAYKDRRKPERLAYNREWVSKNREEADAYQRIYREVNRDKINAVKREWSRAHPEFNVRRAHRRRAMKRSNGGSYTAHEWYELCAKYGHRCLCCGEQKPLTVDHVVPIAKGGSNDISNIQPLCNECNIRKSARIIDYRVD